MGLGAAMNSSIEQGVLQAVIDSNRDAQPQFRPIFVPPSWDFSVLEPPSYISLLGFYSNLMLSSANPQYGGTIKSQDGGAIIHPRQTDSLS